MCLNVLTRRELLVHTALAITGVGILQYMPAFAQTNRESIIIPDDAKDVTPSFVVRALDAVRATAEHVGTSLQLMFKTAKGEVRSLFVSFEHRGGKERIMPVVSNDQEHTLHLNHTGKGKPHNIEFLHTDGQFLERIQEHMKRIWKAIKEKTKGQDAMSLGIKAVAIAIGIWIGIALAKVVLALLGFLLFYAVVIALIIAGALAIKLLLEGYTSSPDRMMRAKQLFVEKGRKFSELMEIVAA